jgi:hypothetical protein
VYGRGEAQFTRLTIPDDDYYVVVSRIDFAEDVQLPDIRGTGLEAFYPQDKGLEHHLRKVSTDGGPRDLTYYHTFEKLNLIDIIDMASFAAERCARGLLQGAQRAYRSCSSGERCC